MIADRLPITIEKLLIAVILLFGNATLAAPSVGFLTPAGVPQELIAKVQFVQINAGSPAQVEDSLRRASGTPFRISVDLGPVIEQPVNPSRVKMRYLDENGKLRKKVFAPEQMVKLAAFPRDEELRKKMAPFMDVLAKYSANVGTLLLADEPYLNGISKSEMERAGRVARQELDARGLRRVQLGVIFASGMFYREFAHMIDRQAGAYVSAIDDYYQKGDPTNPARFKEWVEAIKSKRLSTYDSAGNMYVNGGLPKGFNVVGFDFYLSTILLDGIHEHTLEWLADRYPKKYGCGQFAGQPMKKIRSRLSFFHDGIVLQGDHHRSEDRKLLDSIFECRMGAVTAMLRKAAGARQPQFLMMSESSNNGVLEFDPAGNVKQQQPELLVESRVLDEVRRAQLFYSKNARAYSAGLMYFLYQSDYDKTIKLRIGGASGMPSVLDNILRFAAGR